MKNKLSILIPSRKRPIFLKNSIDSLLSKVRKPENIEILIRMDNDDLETVEIIKQDYEQYLEKTIKILVGNRNGGYFDLPSFYYELSEISTGEWLFVYNDDILMLTDNFDDVFQELNTDKKILYTDKPQGNCGGSLQGGNWCFPIINKKIIEVLGHFTIDTPYTDGWIKTLSEKLNLSKIIPVSLEHSQEILNTMDEVNLDKTFINETAGKNFDWGYHINNPEGLIYKDVEKLRENLN